LNPGYIIVFSETLLTLVAPTLPFDIVVNVSAVLVLLLVSALSVVVGVTGVAAIAAEAIIKEKASSIDLRIENPPELRANASTTSRGEMRDFDRPWGDPFSGRGFDRITTLSV
jgi:hypothetical protein